MHSLLYFWSAMTSDLFKSTLAFMLRRLEETQNVICVCGHTLKKNNGETRRDIWNMLDTILALFTSKKAAAVY